MAVSARKGYIMKRSILLSVVVILVCTLMSSCMKEVAAETEEISEEATVENTEAVAIEVLVSTDGNAIVLGTLIELDQSHVKISTEDNQSLNFNLNPETEYYSGSAAELLPGDEVAIVFEGTLEGLNTDNIKVLTVSIAAEEDS